MRTGKPGGASATHWTSTPRRCWIAPDGCRARRRCRKCEDRTGPALWAIQNHAEAADAPLITAALYAVNGDIDDDGAVSAAAQCLYACDVPEDPSLSPSSA